MSQVPYLGHVFSGKGISPDKQKLSAVKDWPTPQNAADVRKFLGLASYYRRYILHFCDIAKPLHQLTQKDTKFLWSHEHSYAFNTVKDKLIQAQYWHTLSLDRTHPLSYCKQMQAQWAWVLCLNRMVT